MRRQQQLGHILFFIRQTGIDLPGGVRYFCDFVEFHANGTVVFTECKGIETAIYKMKAKQLAEIYPFELNVVKKVPASNLHTNRELEA